MKCGKCGYNSDEEGADEEIDYDIAPGQKNSICWNCWYETYNAGDTIIKDINKIRNSSNTVTTLEYLLICVECKHQTGYGYLWFAIQDGREHVLFSGHKLVTISEIVWQDDEALEILRIDIKHEKGESRSCSI
jgi:hypothetical protein